MAADLLTLDKILKELGQYNAKLVAVSKTKPADQIQEVYEVGHKIFGENYVRELVEKESLLPDDTEWHFIGHMQSNKVKYIAPFISLVHGVDSIKLLKEINKQGLKCNRVIECLVQVHIAEEETKSGVLPDELMMLIEEYLKSSFTHTTVRGLMGMATLTDDEHKIRNEFKSLRRLLENTQTLFTGKGHSKPDILSMGMSSDYRIALEQGSSIVRIGSMIFGERT